MYEEEPGVLGELHGTEDFTDLLRTVTSDSDPDSVVVDDETGGADGSVGPEDDQDSESESEMDRALARRMQNMGGPQRGMTKKKSVRAPIKQKPVDQQLPDTPDNSNDQCESLSNVQHNIR